MATKSLVYKVARFNNEKIGKTLQQLLELALNKKKVATKRKQVVDTEDHFRLINFHGKHKGLRVGEFFDYTQGQTQPLAEFDETAETLKVSALAPPNKESEFLHSILYFCVWNNSVILSQSMSLRAQQFEQYLNWIISESKLFGDGDFLTLADQPPLGIEKDILSTKAIEFNAPINLESSGSNTKKSETKSVTYKPKGVGWDILKELLPPEMSFPRNLNASQIIKDEALEVKLMLSWSRQKKDDPTALLDQISNQLRHIETEVDYAIHTRSGKISKDEFKLRRPISVGITKEGLVKKSDMWERMQEWLEILISEEKIVVDA